MKELIWACGAATVMVLSACDAGGAVCDGDPSCSAGEQCANGICMPAEDTIGGDATADAAGSTDLGTDDGDAFDALGAADAPVEDGAADVGPADTAVSSDTTPGDTGSVETITGPDTVDPGADTVGSGPPTPVACDTNGSFGWCPQDCPPGRFAQRVCGGGYWGSCQCKLLRQDHIATLGGGAHVGLTGTNSGKIAACYAINPGAGVIVATRHAVDTWDLFPVSLFDSSGAGADCDIAAGNGERAHLAYREAADAGGSKLAYHIYDIGSALSAAEYPQAGAIDHGHAPRIALGPGGDVHIVSGLTLPGDEHVLRHYNRVIQGAWNLDEFAGLVMPQTDLAFAMCDDGMPLVTYAGFQAASTSAHIAREMGDGWDAEMLDASALDVGAGQAVACRGGVARGFFQDRTNNRLIDFRSDTPATLQVGYQTAPMTTTHTPGVATDIAIDGDTVFATFAETNGDVWLAARHIDFDAPWRFYGVATSAGQVSGELGDDVALWIDPSGRPVVLYFGVSGDATGPWLATLD